MSDTHCLFLFLIPCVAFLYASVGHGGASGYLALMVLFGISPVLMKPSALMLNIFVSAISFIYYYSKGHFQWKVFWPFILLSIPLAFIGAKINIDTGLYKAILAICLFIATLRIFAFRTREKGEDLKALNFSLAIGIGACIGFISGMIGIGGGILLSPILLLLNWTSMKQTAAISSAFIFLNSISGLVGASMTSIIFSSDIYIWSGLAITGGIIGAWMGSFRFNTTVLKYILGLVLLLACIKLVIV